ncbi:MAG TPA: tripartite tricarboxylate transporter substrate binding protein [Alphaproteobacteria bacterium]
MNIWRAAGLAALAAVCLSGPICGSGVAAAQDYPNRAIRLIAGTPPGGNVDSVARVIAQELTKGLGQPVVVENKVGLVGSLAAELVARSAADGYTLMLAFGAHPVNAAIYKQFAYKPVDDFEWISMITAYPFAVSVRRDSALRSLRDLLDAAKAKPGTVTNGSSGQGSVQHMTAELLGNQADVKFLQVPYKGEAPALTAALAGEVDFLVTTSTLVVPHIGSGTMRTLAVTSRSRWKDLPDVPTVEEAGLAGFEVISWSGLAAPRGTPRAIVERLNAEVLRAVAVPEVKARLESFGGDVHGSTPGEMRDQVALEVARWTKLVRDAKIEQE